ncbi:suppressor of fused domain protein [Stenotrophomonas maltophilia]|uniref:suppressor of fused domain protein n=1 Tax=Stenotrophomonas maltophilia TaxID=40324 RepID=UPI0021C6BDE1|nr:suppressor of fused domain protein [Stenotrophomonas maltophilia]MCU1125810.1 suppressor of fused domain protein [Stenotrophomonas maltophilia]
MGTVTEQHRAVAMHAIKIMGGGGRPKVQAFHDDHRQRSVDILTTFSSPEAGLKSIASIGLSDFVLRRAEGHELETRVELCACAEQDALHWDNVVASTAFAIMRDRAAVQPGSVIPNILQDYFPSTRMPHVYLVPPFFWNDARFPGLQFPPVAINWLQCIAIHESERQLVERIGSDAFDDLLQQQEMDVVGMHRAPVTGAL